VRQNAIGHLRGIRRLRIHASPAHLHAHAMVTAEALTAAIPISEAVMLKTAALFALEFLAIEPAAIPAEMPVAAVHVSTPFSLAPAAAIHSAMMMAKAVAKILLETTLAPAAASAEIPMMLVMMVGDDSDQNQDEDKPVQRKADDGKCPKPGQLAVVGSDDGVRGRRCFVHDGGS
jgi:hypothetical protein